MASFAIARYCLFTLSKHRSITRFLHTSPAALKKKASKLEVEDLFPEEPGEDLLSFTHDTPTHASIENRNPLKLKRSIPSQHLDSTHRHICFEKLYNSMVTYTSSDSKKRRKLLPIRNTVWTRLVDLSQNEAELGKVIALVPKWKDMTRHQLGKGGLEEQWGELIVSRAESLSCPKLALDMFSNHAKYQVPLSLPAARQLLHALHIEHPLEDVMTAVALYRVYNLTPIADDLISLGLVCRALAGRIYQHPPNSGSLSSESSKKENIQAVQQVFEALIQSLRDLLSSTDPSSFCVSPHARTRALTPKFFDRQNRAQKGLPALEKEKTWLKWCLKRIEGNLQKPSQPFEKVAWLRKWREAAGHVKAHA